MGTDWDMVRYDLETGAIARYQFPAGTALRLPASMSIDVNVHYVNRTSNEIPGEAYANLYTVPASSVVKVAHTLNLFFTPLWVFILCIIRCP